MVKLKIKKTHTVYISSDEDCFSILIFLYQISFDDYKKSFLDLFTENWNSHQVPCKEKNLQQMIHINLNKQKSLKICLRVEKSRLVVRYVFPIDFYNLVVINLNCKIFDGENIQGFIKKSLQMIIILI